MRLRLWGTFKTCYQGAFIAPVVRERVPRKARSGALPHGALEGAMVILHPDGMAAEPVRMTNRLSCVGNYPQEKPHVTWPGPCWEVVRS